MIKKLFGEINMTWKKVIIYAIAAGVYTALMAMLVPDWCSFHDIAVTEEGWILLALVVITNCEKPLEAALKTFVFFLISQPLVYLIQVPFSDMGWGLFGYYRYWFMITLLTFPGAFIAWYIKKDNILSGIILSVALVLLCLHGVGYLKSALSEFPHHLLSAVYCIGIIPVFIFIILKNKKAKILSCIISAAALAVILVYTFALSTSCIMSGNVLLDDIGNIQLDESCEVEVSDEAVSKAWIEEDYQGDYQLMMEFYKYDTNTVTITDANGNETVLEIYLDEDKNYRVSKK